MPAGSSGRMASGLWIPLRATLMNGPSQWMPSTPGVPASNAARIAAIASRMTRGTSAISVGKSPVVP
jgi:hypothetical protein